MFGSSLASPSGKIIFQIMHPTLTKTLLFLEDIYIIISLIHMAGFTTCCTVRNFIEYCRILAKLSIERCYGARDFRVEGFFDPMKIGIGFGHRRELVALRPDSICGALQPQELPKAYY